MKRRQCEHRVYGVLMQACPGCSTLIRIGRTSFSTAGRPCSARPRPARRLVRGGGRACGHAGQLRAVPGGQRAVCVAAPRPGLRGPRPHALAHRRHARALARPPAVLVQQAGKATACADCGIEQTETDFGREQTEAGRGARQLKGLRARAAHRLHVVPSPGCMPFITCRHAYGMQLPGHLAPAPCLARWPGCACATGTPACFTGSPQPVVALPMRAYAHQQRNTPAGG